MSSLMFRLPFGRASMCRTAALREPRGGPVRNYCVHEVVGAEPGHLQPPYDLGSKTSDHACANAP